MFCPCKNIYILVYQERTHVQEQYASLKKVKIPMYLTCQKGHLGGKLASFSVQSDTRWCTTVVILTLALFNSK